LLSKDKDIHTSMNCVIGKNKENILMKILNNVVVIERAIDIENKNVYLKCNNIFLINVQS
jgi:hypothetical protein